MTDQAVAAPPEPPRVHIRRYESARHFTVDAPAMAAAGWLPKSQVEASAGARTGLIAAGLLLMIAGFFLYTPLAVLGLILLVAGFISRKRELVVTYEVRPPA